MKINIVEYRGVATDSNGNVLPVGGSYVASQSLVVATAASALNSETRLVRIATDEAVTSNVHGLGSEVLYNAGSEGFFDVAGGETITFAAV